MVLRQGVVLTAVGLTIGVLLMIPIGRVVLPNFVAGTTAFSLEIMLGVPLVLAAAMMAACWIPARRAASVDPIKALRHE